MWQKFIEGSTDATLEYAMFDPVTAKLDKLGTLNDAIQYYVYSSAYVPEIDRFIVVTTTADDRGVAMLIAPDGRRSTACRRRCANPASGCRARMRTYRSATGGC